MNGQEVVRDGQEIEAGRMKAVLPDWRGPVRTTAGISDAAFLRTGSKDLGMYLCIVERLFSAIMRFK